MEIIQTWKRIWIERHNKLWVLPALHSLIAVLLALAAAWIPPLLPADIQFPSIEAKTLDNLLAVISSSMLAVATFSLSIMVAAFASASSGVTPRVTELVMGDEGTQSAISNFLSAFIFSIVAQVALGVKYYGDAGRFILFVATLAVLAWLMFTLLRWVRTLSLLGRLNNTLDLVQSAALECMSDYWRQPLMGAKKGPEDIFDLLNNPQTILVKSNDVQVVRRIDMGDLQALAKTNQCFIHVRLRAGQLVSVGDVMAIVIPDDCDKNNPAPLNAAKALDDKKLADKIQKCFQLDQDRTFDQDPRFSLIVLREAAQRALSSAINDPGTAISCMNAMTRILLKSQVLAAKPLPGEISAKHYNRLSAIELKVDDFIADGFDPIARDGAATFEIMVRIQKALAIIMQDSADPALATAAREHAVFAYDCAMQSLHFAADKATVKTLHHQLFD